MTDSFSEVAINIIKAIPEGKVATYGQIARLAGNPRGARQVVRLLHSRSEKDRLPWHRVINREGRISLKPGYGYELQKSMLEDEGVTFKLGDRIDLSKFLWSPE